MKATKLFIITGASAGIGKSLANLVLEKGHSVEGISRSNSINHPNYKHCFLDLSSAENVHDFQFDFSEIREAYLVNNAGTIGEVKRQGQASGWRIQELFQINLISPAILMNKFIAECNEHNVQGTILNVSSGAGKRPIDAWAPYCASKAGLDLFSETIREEQRVVGQGVRVYSVAPGVVDTRMQQEIRQKEKKDFSQLEKFQALKKNNELVSPDKVAELYYNILLNTDENQPTVFSLRDRM